MKIYILYNGVKLPGLRGEMNRLYFRGETNRGETTREEMVWGRNVKYLAAVVSEHCHY